MSKQRDLKLYLIDILESGNNILNFTKDLPELLKTVELILEEF